MRQIKNAIWTRLLSDKPRNIDGSAWLKHGGKWIVFDDEARILELARKLAPHIDSGEIESAKYWNGDPSAINVYSLDRERAKTRTILKDLGARFVVVWEYDYAWGRNLCTPVTFSYSWFSKFRTILQSRGFRGSIRLFREALQQGRGKGRASEGSSNGVLHPVNWSVREHGLSGETLYPRTRSQPGKGHMGKTRNCFALPLQRAALTR